MIVNVALAASVTVTSSMERLGVSSSVIVAVPDASDMALADPSVAVRFDRSSVNVSLASLIASSANVIATVVLVLPAVIVAVPAAAV